MTAHAGYYGPEILLDGAGRPLRLANVVILQADATTAAVLYTDRLKTATRPSNAVQTDSGGNLAFYADPGQYVLRWTVGGATNTLTVELGQDFSDQGGAVQSVNGHTGVVTLTATDVGADPSGAAASAVTTHTAAPDPHGDRAYTDTQVATRATAAALTAETTRATAAEQTNATAIAAETARAQAAEAAISAGLQFKAVRVVATANVASRSGLATVDGVTLAAGDLVLLVAQSSGSQNGLWKVASGAWTRPSNYAAGSDASAVSVWVEDGTANKSSVWVVAGSPPNVVDTNVTTWQQASGLGEVIAGTGIVKTGNTLSTDPAVVPTVAGSQLVVVHGATASTARPAGATVVHWIGSVAPTNVATNDEWTDTANKIVKRWNGAAFDSLGSAAYLAVTGSDPRWRPDRTLPGLLVGTNGRGLEGPSAVGAAANVTTRSYHAMAVACTDVRLVYANFTSSGNPVVETDPADTYTIKASIEVSGTIYRVLFRGQTSGTVDGGGILISDPLGIEFTAGQVFQVRTYLSTAANWHHNTSLSALSQYGGAATGDLTAPGSGAIADSFSFAYMPSAIIGTPYTRTTPGVGIVGDSIAAGQGDTTQDYAPPATSTSGFVTRALGTSLPYIQAALASERAQQFAAAAGHYRRLALLNGCTHVFEQYGTNDLFVASRTLAQLQADKITLWTAIGNRGMKAHTGTLMPRTTSTDSWATTANQTFLSAGAETYRTGYNDWLRDGVPISAGAAVPVGTAGAARCAVYDATGTLVTAASGAAHPLAAVFEVADAVESARNSGKWKVTGAANYATADGTHPSAAGHALAATAILPANFTL